MLFLYAALAVLTAVLLFLLFAKIKIIFEYKKYPGEKLYTDVQISYGFIKGTGLLKNALSKASGKIKNKEASPDKSIIEKIKLYKETFRIASGIYAKNRWYIRRRLRIDKLNFHLKFGFGDAFLTGIATGAINSMLYWLLAFVSRIGNVKNHYFEVAPVFEGRGFASEAKGSISFRMINILTVGVRLYLTYKRISRNNK